jgi:hypothetical protein
MSVERLFLHQAVVLLAAIGQRPVTRRRAYGTGCLYAQTTSRGEETCYGQFRVGGRLVKRALGPKRSPGSSEGLTRT